MPSKHRSLLEAFRAAGDTHPAGAAPVGGPFVPDESAPATSGEASPLATSSVRVAVIGALLIGGILGFLLGRGTSSTALASGERGAAKATSEMLDGSGALTAAPPESLPTEPATVQPEPAEPVSPLHDTANKWTIVTGTYGRSKSELAWAAHDSLRDKGLPVIAPFELDNWVLLVVGAAPTKKELENVLTKVQEAESPDGRSRPYESAYFRRIDDIWRR